MNANLAWHYTVGNSMDKIRGAGMVKPATAFVPQGEIPVVWFSTKPHWEPTANKIWRNKQGELVFLDFEQSILRGRGGWRLGMPLDQLIPWRQLKAAARISPETVRTLKRSAKHSGSDPMLWYGSLNAISMADCVVQRLEGNVWIETG